MADRADLSRKPTDRPQWKPCLVFLLPATIREQIDKKGIILMQSVSSILIEPGDHERVLEERVSCRFDDGETFDCPLVIVAFTNRSGSNLFCEYLQQTPFFGKIEELLNHPVVMRRLDRYQIASVPDYLREEVARKEKPFFALKASVQQMMMFYRWGLHRMFPAVRVLHVMRSDPAAQAVSFYIASETKQWSSFKDAVQPPPEYDFQKISTIMHRARMSDAAIPAAAGVFGTSAIPVVYEDVVRDPKSQIDRVLSCLGHPDADFSPKGTKHRKQDDPVKADYLARYREDLRRMVAA